MSSDGSESEYALCNSCAKPVDSVVEGVRCTISCASCCMRLDPVLVHKTRALGLGCKEIDLRQILCKTTRNPHKRSSLMYLYLREEVNALAEERHAERRRLEEEKEIVKRAAAASRRAKLLRKGITEESVPEPLRDFVFGDHLSSERKVPETPARHVTSHYRAAVRAGEVLGRYANLKSTATYQAVTNFAQTHETCETGAILRRIFNLRDLQTDVLKIVGVDVLVFLKKGERASAELAVPEFERAVAARDGMRTRSLVRAFERIGVPYPPDSKSLWRVKRFQDDVDIEEFVPFVQIPRKKQKNKKHQVSAWPDAASKRVLWTASDVAESVKSFQETRKDPEARRASLKAATSVYEIPIRPDSRFAQQYILGEIDVDPEEITAVMMTTKALFEISHRAYSHLHARYEGVLRAYVWKNGASWKAAIAKTLGDIDNNRFEHEEYEDSDIDEFDEY